MKEQMEIKTVDGEEYLILVKKIVDDGKNRNRMMLLPSTKGAETFIHNGKTITVNAYVWLNKEDWK